MSSRDIFNLKNKNALVIGAGGIGREGALTLAEHGANVVAVDISEENLKLLAELGKNRGVHIDYFVADIDNKGSIENLFAKYKEIHGSLDILLNSAGIGRMGRAVDLSEEDWNTVVNHFLNGVFFSSQEAAKIMIPNKGGKIINIASISGLIVMGDFGSSYSTAKGGVIQLTKALGTEWIKHNINVNAISPGIVKTALTEGIVNDAEFSQVFLDKTPIGRFAEPKDIAGTILFLASSASDYIVGQNIVVDGGYTSW